MFTALLLVTFLLGCSKEENVKVGATPSGTAIVVSSPIYSIDSLPVVQGFYKTEPVKLARLTTIDEGSGLDVSLANPSYLWTHNDGGNDNQIFLLDKQTGEWTATYTLTNGRNFDWEDMSITTDRRTNLHYILVGDIGDNLQIRGSYSIYKFQEPILLPTHYLNDNSISPVIEEIRFSYPNGSKNSEAMAVDPETDNIYVFSRTQDTTEVFVSLSNNRSSGTNELTLVAKLPFGRVTSCDISKDGNRMIVRTHYHIVYWEKESHQKWYEVFDKTPFKLPYNGSEPQGEGVCWDGLNYYTISEKVANITPKLYRYEKL